MRNQYINITRVRDSVDIYTDSRKDLLRAATIQNTKSDTLDVYVSQNEIEKAIGCLENDKDVDIEKVKTHQKEPDYYTFGGAGRVLIR